MPIGILYGISVGPGDPELLTVKALRRLQQAAIVAHPAGINGKPGFAEQIIAPWLTSSQTKLALTFPYVQDEEALSHAWKEAADKVWVYLVQGQDVVFACEGDVSFYSTFTYLAQTVMHFYPEAQVQAIPGVCSPLASAAALGIPLTVRQDRLAVIPALYQPKELESILQWAETVVLMKVSSVYEQVWALLDHYGLLEQSVVVEWATLPQQVIHRQLQTKPSLKLPYFSLMIVKVRK